MPHPLSVTVLADYGPLSDMAFAEVTQSLYTQLDGIESRLKEYSIPPFDTVQTGFMLAQAAINSQLGENHIFYVNTAPRHDDNKPRVDSAGEKLVYMKLYNGVRIVAVNSGHSLSFVKDAAIESKIVKIANEGSQFRSRDFYPTVVGAIARGDESMLLDKAPHIEEAPEDVVGFVDGYGNLKCTIDPAKIESHMGKFTGIEIGGARHFVKIGKSIFDVPDGYLCMAKGSSGWTLSDGSRKEFTEIIRRSGNAFLDFRKPKGGTAVNWEIVS